MLCILQKNSYNSKLYNPLLSGVIFAPNFELHTFAMLVILMVR